MRSFISKILIFVMIFGQFPVQILPVSDTAFALITDPMGSGDPNINLTSNLKLWLDAADVSSMYSNTACTTAIAGTNGNKVACWKDKSGNNNHVSQAITVNQPILDTVSTVFNGQKTLDFDTTDSLLKDITDWSGDSTVFIVMSSDSSTPSTFEAFFANNNNPVTAGAFQVDYDSTEEKFRYIIRNGGMQASTYF